MHFNVEGHLVPLIATALGGCRRLACRTVEWLDSDDTTIEVAWACSTNPNSSSTHARRMGVAKKKVTDKTVLGAGSSQ